MPFITNYHRPKTCYHILYNIPDHLVLVPGPLEDVSEGEPGGPDAAHNGPAHRAVRVMRNMEQVGLNSQAFIIKIYLS